MQSLVVFSCLIAATLAATFFESPDNPKAVPFYKKPAGHYAPSAPVFHPEPVYKPVPAPVYKPEPYKPVYKPEPYKPAYKPEPYQPAYKAPEYKPDYKPEPYKPSYKPEPYGAAEHGHGATSYQKVSLEVGESSYKSEYKPHY